MTYYKSTEEFLKEKENTRDFVISYMCRIY